MTRHWLNDDVTPAEQAAFASLESMLALQGDLINESKLSYLKRVRVGEKYYFVKVYHYAGRNLRRFTGPSRVSLEWKNQRRFAAMGIPTARIVAFSERKRILGTYKGIVVTEEVRDTTDLWTLIRNQPDQFHNGIWLKQVIDRLAGYVRSIHESGFIHGDLKWRNILADFSNRPEVYIIDCPQGRVLVGPWFRRGVIKDLACLDRIAKQHLSRTSRLRFFKRYHQTEDLTEAHRKQIIGIVRFFEGRD